MSRRAMHIEELNGRVMRLEEASTGGGSMTVQELDGSPSGSATTLVFPDGYVSGVAGNTATIVADPAMVHCLFGGI